MPTPAPIAKCTFFFSDGKYGWSETYCQSLLTGGKLAVSQSLASVMPAVLRLAAKRGNMLPGAVGNCSNITNRGVKTTPVLEYIRISQVGVPRNSLFYSPSGGELVTPAGAANINVAFPSDTTMLALTADNPYSAVEMEISLGNGLVTRRAISGVPDSVVCDQEWSYNSSWYTLWKAFAQQLFLDQWGVLSSSVAANGVNLTNATPILGISQQDDIFCRPYIQVGSVGNFVGSGNICGGNYVQIVCYKSNPGPFPNLNGIYRIGTITPATILTGSATTQGFQFQLNKSFKCLNPFNLGYVLPYAGPAFVPITGAQLTRTILKKRGSPFDRPHGKRKTVK